MGVLEAHLLDSRGIVSLEALCYKTAWGCWQELLASGEQAWPGPEPEPGQPTACAARGAGGRGEPWDQEAAFPPTVSPCTSAESFSVSGKGNNVETNRISKMCLL